MKNRFSGVRASIAGGLFCTFALLLSGCSDEPVEEAGQAPVKRQAEEVREALGITAEEVEAAAEADEATVPVDPDEEAMPEGN